MSFMRKIGLITSLALVILILRSPRSALAHFPASDGSMTAILHVDPNDDPTPGQPAKLNFIFDDMTNRFSLKKCVCNLLISEQGRVLDYTPLSPASSTQPSVYGAMLPFTFPNRDVYQIKLSGQPVATGAFQSFSLTWNLRVDQDTLTGQGFSLRTFAEYFATIFGALVLVGLVIYFLS